MSQILWQNADRRIVHSTGGPIAQKRTGGRWRPAGKSEAEAIFKQAGIGRASVNPAPSPRELETAQHLLQALFAQHPWHGVSPGAETPHKLTAYIEIVPTDTVKYELDKTSGLLKIDRPHQFSNTCPTLYGFVPQTYCGKLIGQRCSERTGTEGIVGDGDPLDICVLTQKTVTQGNILLRAIPIGGLRMIDGNQADDKIIAVLENDAVYGGYKDITDVPARLINPLRHYFLTYKQIPGEEKEVRVKIAEVYGADEAFEVIRRSQQDYADSYGSPAKRIAALASMLTARN